MTTPQPVSLPWNLVTQNLHGHELLRKKLREKITNLEKHLKRFPPDAVHLQINQPLSSRHEGAFSRFFEILLALTEWFLVQFDPPKSKKEWTEISLSNL